MSIRAVSLLVAFGVMVLLTLEGVPVASHAPAVRGQTATGTQPRACEVEAVSKIAPNGSTVAKTTLIAATGRVPGFCQIDAQVATEGNTLNIRLRLPAAWNGKFFFHGVGGFAGSVEDRPPSEDQINSMLPGLLRGYAVASTDTGHSGAGTDATWALGNPAKIVDYAYRGTHVATGAAKALTEAYYAQPPRLSYFGGCSNGGRQALMEAQRYPMDFDGIIAGDPSIGTTGIHRTLGYQTMLASSDAYIPAAKLELIDRSVLAACDRLDGLVDGLVSDPARCNFKPDTLLCTGTSTDDCLSKDQVATLKKLYSGFRSRDNKVKTFGYPMGHESGPSGWRQWIVGTTNPEHQRNGTLSFTNSPPLGYQFQDQSARYLLFQTQNPRYDWRKFDLDRDAPKLRYMSDLLRPTSDLVRFSRRGKLILYHGWADPGISAYSTIDYYGQVVKAVGGQQKADDFMRLFLAPGLTHCTGGPGPNVFVGEAIRALEAWVEQGEAPTSLIATHSNTAGVVDRSRPLCAWPQVAKYKGTGSIDDAANFVCAKP